jgi:DNA polymerase-3 subunit epsilon
MNLILEWWRRRRAARGALATRQRWVVVDCETSGLDVKTDRLLSIGAVAVSEARLVLEDSFVAVLRQPRASGTANILIHGISGTAQQHGVPAADALRDFAAYAARDPLVGFHVAFDRAMLTRVAGEHGLAFAGRIWLDLAELLPVLFDTLGKRCKGLDDWLGAFSIRHPARHDALGDAYATAQLFQVALAEAQRHGLRSVRDLMGAGTSRKWVAGAG